MNKIEFANKLLDYLANSTPANYVIMGKDGLPLRKHLTIHGGEAAMNTSIDRTPEKVKIGFLWAFDLPQFIIQVDRESVALFPDEIASTIFAQVFEKYTENVVEQDIRYLISKAAKGDQSAVEDLLEYRHATRRDFFQ